MRELEEGQMFFCHDMDDSLECIACVHAYKIVATVRPLIRVDEIDEARAVWVHYVDLFGQQYQERGLYELHKSLAKAMLEVLQEKIEMEIFIEGSRN